MTGANVGLGLSSAKILASKGAKTIMGCRTKSKCQDAITAYSKEEGSNPAAVKNMIPMTLDLSSLASVKSFVTSYKAAYPGQQLDILMLNAGVMIPPHTLTTDGIELQFGVNHVAHQYLTVSLLDSLSTRDARVVVVSSNAHFNSYDYGVALNLDTINNKETYDAFKSCKYLQRERFFDTRGVYVVTLLCITTH